MYIIEILYKYDCEIYVSKILELFENKGFIIWDDVCGEYGFGFKVKFCKEYFLSDNEEECYVKIMKDFGLIECCFQNIMVINEKGKL